MRKSSSEGLQGRFKRLFCCPIWLGAEADCLTFGIDDHSPLWGGRERSTISRWGIRPWLLELPVEPTSAGLKNGPAQFGHQCGEEDFAQAAEHQAMPRMHWSISHVRRLISPCTG